MSSPKSRTSLRILRKTLSPSKRDLTQKIQPGQTSRTETFLTILSESFLAINNNVCPFEDQIRALRLTVKHLHSGERWDNRAVQFLVQNMFEGAQFQVFDFLWQSLTSNVVQKCTFKQFESESKLQFVTWSLNNSFGPFSNCPNVHFWSRFKVRFWTKSIYVKKIRDTELLQTLFLTKNRTLI